MNRISTTKRAADVLVGCLIAHEVKRLYCVPGESYLALLDALVGVGDIDVITSRHEGGAGLMAVAEAKITGRPTVAAVSRGPGAMNAAIAVHVAEQDAVPLVLLIGQVARRERGRDAFQEVDYTKTFSDIAKGVWEVHEPAHLPEILARAFHVAAAGTPGPTVLVLPEDMLSDACDTAVVPPLPVATTGPGEAEIAAVLDRLKRSERPLLIAGGALGSERGRVALARAAERLALPVALSFKRQDVFDNTSARYAGYLGFKIPRPQVDQLAEADLVLAVGTRLTDVTTQGYRLPRAPVPDQPLIHVYQDPSRIGRVFRTDIGLACDPVAFLERLADADSPTTLFSDPWVRRLNETARKLMAYEPEPVTDGVDFGLVVRALIKRASPDTAIITDAGNFSGWVHRMWPFRTSNLMIGTVGGAMGIGMPAAIAAGLVTRERPALTFIGDGGMLMTGAELATAIRYGVAVKVFVANNASYGTIRLHQERDYPGRVSGTDLTGPDFATFAEAFGAKGMRISTADDVEPVVEAALAASEPVVVDVRTSLEALSAYTTITRLRSRS